jgi:hypothetical protein
MSQTNTIDWSKYEAPPAAAPSIDFTKYDSSAPQKKSWLDEATDFAKEYWNQVNPVSGIKGAAQAVAHPVDTYMADASNRQALLDKAQDAFKKGDYGEGVAHALYGIVPFLGPQLDKAGTQIGTGEAAKGLGATAGMATNLMAPSILKKAAVNLPGPIADYAGTKAAEYYKSALKPSTVAQPARVASAVTGGLENEIPVSAGGLEKLGDLIDELNGKIAGEIASRPGATVNKYAVASRLGQTAQNFASQVNPDADLNAVANSGNEFLTNQPTNIPASDAQAIKQGTYSQIRKNYGQLSSATVESQKALARGIKEELANQFPELSQLNAQDSQAINLDKFLQRAVSRISNHQLVGIGTPIVAGTAKAVTGSSGVAGVAGVMKAVLDDPYIKSKVAIALNKASKGSINLPVGLARYDGYVNALGNASNAEAPNDQGQQ